MVERTNPKTLLIISVLLLAVGMGTSSVFATGTYDDADGRVRVDRDFGKMPLYFIENQGQLDKEVGFYVQGSDKTLYFTPQGVTFALAGKKAESEETQQWSVKLDFVGANPDVRPKGEDRQQAVISYFKGKPEDWQTGLATYSRIVYPELWDGIDLVYSGSVNELKYEFVVKPGADAKQIRLAYRGAGKVTVKETGELMVDTAAGGFADGAPYAYQEIDGRRAAVSMAYTLEEGSCEDIFEYGFDIGPYDRSRPLILDPAVLIYCGYIGGTGPDYGGGIAVDAAGCAYVAGSTYSSEAMGFPVVVGPDLTLNSNNGDAFVAKVNAAGTALLYCGYIGGSDWSSGRGIAVDEAGNAYVTGHTCSSEAEGFPVVVGPDLTFNSSSFDAYVAKVNAAGTGLDYCGYIGGTDLEDGHDIAVDAAGNAYVTGYTWSSEASFPVAVGPDLTHNGGSRDAFVAKVKVDGTALEYCGYIGGSDKEYGNRIAVDDSGNAYVTGETSSTEASFPVVVGPDLTHNGGGEDAFVAKVKADGTALDYCGYIGGTDEEYGKGIAVDAAGNAYVTGSTGSTEASFPVAVGPDLTHNGGGDTFVAKVKPVPTEGADPLFYCGYIGGAGDDGGGGIAVDADGNAYVTGNTSSTESTFPVLVGPDLTFNGGGYYGTDAFVARVKPVPTERADPLVYCGYIGGADDDTAARIAVDASGNAYVTGSTKNTEASFPVVVGPDLTHNDGFDVFVAKISRWRPTDIYYVDANTPDNNDGSNWANAFKYLQDAITVAGYDSRILVANGTYCPDATTADPCGTGDRGATFQLVDGVAIEGGYAGYAAPNPNARNIALYETILSGDLNGNDVQGLDPCDLLNDPNRGENSYHVVTGSWTSAAAVLHGLTITGGNADGPDPNNFGGGMYNYQGNPTVTNCRFTGNRASDYGGGMFNDNSSPTVTSSTFGGNIAVYGGGMWNDNSNPMVTNCTFIANSATTRGGGMCNYSSSNPTVTNCTFSGNDGSGMYNYQGSPMVTNCTFSGNSATTRGGGMYNYNSSNPTVTDCTFSGNSAGDGGGMCNELGSIPIITNCIMWGDTASTGDEIFNDTSIPEISYSDIQGCGASGIGWNNPLGTDGGGNIDADPLLADADGPDDTVGTEDDNLRLSAGSACIDAGVNATVPADTADLDNDGNTAERIPLDLDYGERFLDDPCTVDTGLADPPACPNVVDMGAYEYHYGTGTCWDTAVCAGQPFGDATCDGPVNLADLFALKAHFGKSAPWTPPECCADFTQDASINLADLFALKAGFGTSGYSPSTGNQNCPP